MRAAEEKRDVRAMPKKVAYRVSSALPHMRPMHQFRQVRLLNFIQGLGA